jgi:hypothetical protein
MEQESTQAGQSPAPEAKDNKSSQKPASPNKTESAPQIDAGIETENELSDNEDSDNSATPEKKRNRKTAQERIKELVNQKKELEAKLQLSQAPVVNNFAEPKEEQFQTYGEYQEARAAWRAVQMLQQRDAQANQQREQISQQAQWEVMQKNYLASSETARKIYPDFDTVVSNSPVLQLNEPAFVQAVGATDNSAEVTYYLAKNPELVTELLNLRYSPAALGARIGEISARVSFNRGKSVRKVDAPTSLTTLGTGNTGKPLDTSRALKEMPPVDYLEWRRKQKEQKFNRSA